MAGDLGAVTFSVPREVAFDYLVDPRHRPEWQSSLRRVSAVDGEPRVGQTWVDETKLLLKPRMCTTELVRPSRWSETGTWRSVRADLTLDFHEAPGGCSVDYRLRFPRAGVVRGLLLGGLATRAVTADLRRAARILSSRS